MTLWQEFRRRADENGGDNPWIAAAGGAVVGVVLVVVMYIGRGKKPELLDLVMVPLSVAVMAGLGAALHGLRRYVLRPVRSWASQPRNIVKLVLAVALVAAVGVVWWRYGGSSLAWMQQHPAPAGRYPVRAIPQSAWVPTPAPLSDAFVIMIVVLFGLFRIAEQGRMAYQRPGGLAARRAALGAACLAVLALVIVSSANDVGGFPRLLQFAEQLAATPQSWTMWATLGGLGALLFIGGVCLAVGLCGPFFRDGIQLAKDFVWFAVPAGLWAWGAFLPPDFEWFDALGMPTGLRIFNYGLLCWYLFTAVENGVSFLLSLGIFGGGDPLRPFVGGGGPMRPVR